MQILEVQSGSTTSTKQFVWCGTLRVEARNASGSTVGRYFPFGQQLSGTSYYCTSDHLGSIREFTDGSSNLIDQLSYDLFGNVISPKSALAPDFGFAGYYFHTNSGLSLTLNRTYNSHSGRWLSRDPIEEAAINNLYDYVQNAPVEFIDPLGLFHIPGTNFCGAGYSSGHSGFGYGEDSPYYPTYGTPRRGNPAGGVLGPLDLCCEQHDDCMNRAHHMANANDSSKARGCCHRQLVGCAAKATASHPWIAGISVPFGILFGGLSFAPGSGTYTPPPSNQPFDPFDFTNPE